MRRDLAAGEDAVAVARSDDSESLVLVVMPGRDAVSESQVRAAIGPLAVERAPRRISAVLPSATADSAAVDAIVAFLESAASTTGQVVEIS
jgi:hypothetical protein